MKIIILFLVCFGSVNIATAQNETNKQQFNIDKYGIAISGYDPVSYLDQKKATEGNKSFSYNYKGVKYYFSSVINLNKFKAEPEKYLPAYGGWCAFAMGDYGEKVEIDPATFKIINGRTYLFYNFYFNNTLKSWNKNEQPLLLKANSNWSNYLSKN